MDIILIHLGKGIPAYLSDCVRQLRVFNPRNPVFLITGSDNFPACRKLHDEFNVELAPVEDFGDSRVRRFGCTGCVATAKRFIKRVVLRRKDVDFWISTATRFFYLENFVHQRGLKDFVHFENDIMVYFAVDSSVEALRRYPNIAITPGSDTQIMTGFAFFRDWRAVRSLNDFMMESLVTSRKVELLKRYRAAFVSEMLLMRAFADERGPEFMGFLPILPHGPHSDRLAEFGAVFDPASYGQFVGGVMGVGTPGFVDKEHYIGREFSAHRDYCVVWRQASVGQVPYLRHGDKTTRINNLHVHSKHLADFSSISA